MTGKQRPLLPVLAIAHRAGNEIAALRRAEAAGVDLIEADIWRYHGRLEVRHLKTAGRLPLLWDRWRLAPAWTPRLSLAELLQEAHPGTELMLDLKGRDRLLPRDVMDVIERRRPGRPITVCTQGWRLLEPFRDLPNIRIVHSVGGQSRLHDLERQLARYQQRALSIHQRLLTPPAVRELQELVDLIMTWPVNTRTRLRELELMGVQGMISDDLPLLAGLVLRRDGLPSDTDSTPASA